MSIAEAVAAEGVRISNYEDVEMLRSSLSEADHADSTVPNLLAIIIKRGAWMDRLDPYSDAPLQLKPSEFRRFITDEPRLGLGQDFQELKDRFCRTESLLDLWDKATVGKPGGNNNPAGRSGKPAESINRNIITVDSRPDAEPERGTSKQYAIRKLRQDAPELHARVLAGDISPHRAMIEAGFRTPMINLPADPLRAARILAKHFTPDQFGEMARAYYEAMGEHDR